jgi:hypothetical protein
MKPLDLLEFFDKGTSTFAFIATYEFDPQFFERRMLGRKAFASAERLVIFMDRGRYQELLQGGLLVAGFNRRYLVIPVDRKGGAFHPKLHLTLGDKRADGIVGSNNCTTAELPTIWSFARHLRRGPITPSKMITPPKASFGKSMRR